MYSDTILISPVLRASFAIIRPDLRAICDGSKAAAALIAAFQFFTHTEIESWRVNHGPAADIPEAVFWIKASCQRLIDFLGGGFSPRGIHTALELLESKGYLQVATSRTRDRVKRYHLGVEQVNAALAGLTWEDLLTTGISEAMAKSMIPVAPKLGAEKVRSQPDPQSNLQPDRAQKTQLANLQNGEPELDQTCKIANLNLQNCKSKLANLQDDLYLGSNKGSLKDLDPLYPPKGEECGEVFEPGFEPDSGQPEASEPSLTNGKPKGDFSCEAEPAPGETNFSAADFQDSNSEQNLSLLDAYLSGELVVPKTKAIPDVALELFRQEYNRCRPSTWAEALRINAERRKLFQRLWEDCDRSLDQGCQLIQEALAEAKLSNFWSKIQGDVEKLLRKQRYQSLAEQLQARNGNADAIHGSGWNQDQIQQAKAEHEMNQARAVAEWMMNPVGPPPPGAQF